MTMYSEKKYRQRISLGQSGNALTTLVAICLILFVGLAFMKAVWYFRFPQELAPALFTKNVLGWFTLSANTESLLNKPWTPLTQMFVHDNVWRVFSNMLWLWSFGYILQDLTGNRKIVPIFIYGGLAGGIAFLLTYNLVPSLQGQAVFATTMGASPAIMALAVATTLISPRYKIFPLIGGGLPLWALTALYVIISLATVSISDTGNLVSQLAGATVGFLYVVFLRMGYDGSEWMSNFFDWVNNLFNPDKPKKGRSVRDELFYKTTTPPYHKTPHVTQERIDEILDKINQRGYQQLSAEEKDLLRRAGEENRN